MHVVELVSGGRHAILRAGRHPDDGGGGAIPHGGVRLRRPDGELVVHHRLHRLHERPRARPRRPARALRQNLRQAVDATGTLPGRNGHRLAPLHHQLPPSTWKGRRSSRVR